MNRRDGMCNFTQSQVLANTADGEPYPVAVSANIDMDYFIDNMLDLQDQVLELRRDGETEVEAWRARFHRAMWFAAFGWGAALWVPVVYVVRQWWRS